MPNCCRMYGPMLYEPELFAVVEYGPWIVPSGHLSTVLVTVAPGVAEPTKFTFVTPAVGLLGESEPVRFTIPGFTVRLTVDAACVTDPLAPCRMMLPKAPGVV